jgi:hypothetical protein
MTTKIKLETRKGLYEIELEGIGVFVGDYVEVLGCRCLIESRTIVVNAVTRKTELVYDAKEIITTKPTNHE